MPAKRKASSPKDSTATIGFEAKLWLAADKLRNNMDAAEYKHVVLGLIFLKYISDTFEEHRAKLLAGEGDYEGADPEDLDEYKAENVFWVPADARWPHLQASAKQPTIGKTVDDAMVAIERDNPRLKGVLPKDYARPGLDKHRLGELIDLIATIDLVASNQPSPQPSPSRRGSGDSELPSTSGRGAGGEGRPTHRSVDLLGRVYEYFLTRFASAEGKNGGQFYTPSCVVRCLVEMLAPYNANFAWVQHFIHHLAPQGMAGFVLANGSMSSNQSGEGEIRKALIEADLVDCMVALPGQLFYSTQIPVCLWFISRDKSGGKPSARPLGHPSPTGRRDGDEGCLRDRRRETLFIDARKMGTLIDRVHRELTDEDLEKITSTYHAWRGDSKINHPKSSIVNYSDILGFCKSATTAEISAHGHVLTPGRYVGAEETVDDGDPFEEKMPRLVAELESQFADSAKLEAAIRANLKGLGYAL